VGLMHSGLPPLRCYTNTNRRLGVTAFVSRFRSPTLRTRHI
jgi:hypothetical protein